MRIEGFSNASYHINTDGKANNQSTDSNELDYASNLLALRESSTSIEIPRVSSQEVIRDYAEYYFKAGKSYEEIQSYRQALSAYERSNVVDPGANAAKVAQAVRSRLFTT